MTFKPSLPKGTRDLLPAVMLQRNYILSIIRAVFKKYGFKLIETPALEKVETLTGKYGEEGDRLIFKLMPRGDKMKKALVNNTIETAAEEALRYDLTVPLARFVVQNQNELTFPFKRFQIQPVWRADRPQKGRYREFVQCDADALGSTSLLQDLEFLAIYDDIFQELKLPVVIKINNRKLLAGLAEAFGVGTKFTAFTVALDKLDKIGQAGVVKELTENDFSAKTILGFEKMVNLQGDFTEKLKQLENLGQSSAIAKEGIKELKTILENVQALGLTTQVELDITLARGLDYYTGSIFEVKALGVDIGSVGGGGRYNDLTSIFGKKDLPGVGISFGLDRIHLCLEELNLFPSLSAHSTQVLMANFGSKEALHSLQLAQKLRKLKVKTEVYPDTVKLKKQLDYANKNEIEYVILVGEKEIEEGLYLLKDMRNGEQKKLSQIEILEHFNKQDQSSYGLH